MELPGGSGAGFRALQSCKAPQHSPHGARSGCRISAGFLERVRPDLGRRMDYIEEPRGAVRRRAGRTHATSRAPRSEGPPPARRCGTGRLRRLSRPGAPRLDWPTPGATAQAEAKGTKLPVAVLRPGGVDPHFSAVRAAVAQELKNAIIVTDEANAQEAGAPKNAELEGQGAYCSRAPLQGRTGRRLPTPPGRGSRAFPLGFGSG